MKSAKCISTLLMILFTCTFCVEQTEEIPSDIPEQGSWCIYSPLQWTHDGQPLTGTLCKVYSDGASISLKAQCLDFAERMFGEIRTFFRIDEDHALVLPPENDRINVYINTAHEENIAYAYWGTIFITVRMSELNEILYEYLFKHELTHELEFMVEGKLNLGTPVWFRESIAIYCGGGFNRIRTETDLDQWILENEKVPGMGNPILVKEWSDFPPGADIDRYYWYAFDLVMRYLLDPSGMNKHPGDVLSLFCDIRNGIPFESSFRDHFDLEPDRFEEEFFDRMREYLNKISTNKNNSVQNHPLHFGSDTDT